MPSSPDPAAAPRQPAAVYHVEGAACPHLLNRLVGLAAQQDRIPQRVHAACTGDRLTIDIHLTGIDLPRAAIIAEKMRSMTMVDRVEFDFAD